MNCDYDRHVIARGIDSLRTCAIDELAQAVHIPASYMEAIVIRREDDFGDLFVQQIATALDTTVDKIIDAGR